MDGEPDDGQLVLRWSRGDKAAAQVLVERYFDVLFAFFSSKIEIGADDLVQQTLLACVEQRERLAHVTTFRAYLFGIARHKLYAKLREGMLAFDPLNTSVRDAIAGPSARLSTRADGRKVAATLSSLPVDHQLILELHYWQGMSSAEMSDVLELPASTIRSRLGKARELLRASLGQTGLTAALQQLQFPRASSSPG